MINELTGRELRELRRRMRPFHSASDWLPLLPRETASTLLQSPSPNSAPKSDTSGIQEEIFLNPNGTPPSASWLSAKTETSSDIDGAAALRATRKRKLRSVLLEPAVFLGLPVVLVSLIWLLSVAVRALFSGS